MECIFCGIELKNWYCDVKPSSIFSEVCLCSNCNQPYYYDELEGVLK